MDENDESLLAPSVHGLVRALRRHPPRPTWSVAEHRATLKQAAERRAVAPDVTLRAADVGDLAVEWHLPRRAADDTVLLYLHGGGFIMGSHVTTRPLASHLASITGRRVLVVDYALAPEARFPTQIDQALSALDWLEAGGVAPGSVVLAGDSAGAGLALAAAQRLRDETATSLAGLLLLSPLLDLRLSAGSIDAHARHDPQTPRWLLQLMADSYLGAGVSADNPRASPLLGELSGLPPMLVQVAELEALHDDARSVVVGAGGTATLQVWPGMIHVWHAFAPRVPEASEALRAVARWLDTLP